MNQTPHQSSAYLWALPFCFFLVSYIGLHTAFSKQPTPMPNLAGGQLAQAVRICSAMRLRIEIIESKEDSDLPDGTIIKQLPMAGNMIKERQTVFLAVSAQPKPPLAPACIGLSRSEIQKICINRNLKPIFFDLPYPYPQGHCFCQWPAPEKPVKSKIICYVAHEENYVLWPDFRGQECEPVSNFLKNHGINVRHEGQIQPDVKLYITDQQPKVGALVQIAQSDITAYFKVNTKY